MTYAYIRSTQEVEARKSKSTTSLGRNEPFLFVTGSLLYSSGFPNTSYVEESGLDLGDWPASVTWMLWLKVLTTQPSWDCHKKQDGLVRLLSDIECNVLFFKTWVQFPAPILSAATTWSLNFRGSDSLWSRLCRTHMKITKLNKRGKNPLVYPYTL